MPPTIEGRGVSVVVDVFVDETSALTAPFVPFFFLLGTVPHFSQEPSAASTPAREQQA